MKVLREFGAKLLKTFTSEKFMKTLLFFLLDEYVEKNDNKLTHELVDQLKESMK